MELQDLIGTELPERDLKKWAEADAFYEIGQNIKVQSQTELKNNDELVEEIHTVPAIVNLAFACELYLKGFFSGKKSGHYLHTLFEEIPEVIRNVIRLECIQNGIASSEDGFNSRLLNISNAFAEWRYFYEDEKTDLELDLEFLKRFAFCLHEIKVFYKD